MRIFLAFLLLIMTASAAFAQIPSMDSLLLKKPGWHETSFQTVFAQRWFRVYVPANAQTDDLPVVVLLHGGTQSMRKIFRPSAGGTREWENTAEREKFILLVPNGMNAESGDTKGDHQNWNDGRSDAPDTKGNADDVGFISDLVKWSLDYYGADARKVFVTGASNGGMMTYRLLIEMPEMFAGGAAFIANLPRSPSYERRAKKPVPIMIMNGTEDPLIKDRGGSIAKDRGEVISTEETVSWWVAANRADPKPVIKKMDNKDPEDGCRTIFYRYPAKGKGGVPVHYYKNEGGGHAVPSVRHKIPEGRFIRRAIGTVCRDFEGADIAWSFFRSLVATP